MSRKVPNSLACFMACFSVAGTANSAISEDLEVTAKKHSQSMGDIPATIYAFIGKVLENLGLNAAKNTQNLTPVLVWPGTRDTGKSGRFLRGVGIEDFQVPMGNRVAVYLDGVV